MVMSDCVMVFFSLFSIYSFYAAAALSLCTLYALKAFNFAADQVAQLTVEGQGMLVADSDLWGYVMPLRKLGWCQWIGAAVFSWGWLHQLTCHAVLVRSFLSSYN